MLLFIAFLGTSFPAEKASDLGQVSKIHNNTALQLSATWTVPFLYTQEHSASDVLYMDVELSLLTRLSEHTWLGFTAQGSHVLGSTIGQDSRLLSMGPSLKYLGIRNTGWFGFQSMAFLGLGYSYELGKQNFYKHHASGIGGIASLGFEFMLTRSFALLGIDCGLAYAPQGFANQHTILFAFGFRGPSFRIEW